MIPDAIKITASWPELLVIATFIIAWRWSK
jgi:hypothetical protein